jgi:hypothetical protein
MHRPKIIQRSSVPTPIFDMKNLMTTDRQSVVGRVRKLCVQDGAVRSKAALAWSGQAGVHVLYTKRKPQ